MKISTQVIPHTYRNKYLKNSSASTVVMNGSSVTSNTTNTGSSGGSADKISPHYLWGNVFDGTADVTIS